MNISVNVIKQPLIEKIEEIRCRVEFLREQITEDAPSEKIIQEAAIIRTCLDELEKLVFERYSRECFINATEQDESEVNQLLVVLQRLFK